VLRWKHAAGHHSVSCRSAYFQSTGGFVERDLAALSTFAITIDSDTMRVSKTADMRARPAGAMRRRLSRAVQDGGDRTVWQLPRQHTDQIDDTGFDRPAGMANFVLPDLHLSVIAALPMDDKRQGIISDIDNDLFDEQPDNLLARFGRYARPGPGPAKSLPKVISLARSSAERAVVCSVWPR
jgi:hypothetical protein